MSCCVGDVDVAVAIDRDVVRVLKLRQRRWAAVASVAPSARARDEVALVRIAVESIDAVLILDGGVEIPETIEPQTVGKRRVLGDRRDRAVRRHEPYAAVSRIRDVTVASRSDGDAVRAVELRRGPGPASPRKPESPRPASAMTRFVPASMRKTRAANGTAT